MNDILNIHIIMLLKYAIINFYTYLHQYKNIYYIKYKKWYIIKLMKNQTLLLTTLFVFVILFHTVNAEELTDQAGFKFKKPEKVERLVIVFPQSFVQ